jgi:HEAT repeat protein
MPLAKTDVDTFISAISALDPDAHWSVRASLATTLGDLPRERAQAPLTAMLSDSDQRVHPGRARRAGEDRRDQRGQESHGALKSDDPVVRAAAARGWRRSRRRTPCGADSRPQDRAGDGLYARAPRRSTR